MGNRELYSTDPIHNSNSRKHKKSNKKHKKKSSRVVDPYQPFSSESNSGYVIAEPAQAVYETSYNSQNEIQSTPTIYIDNGVQLTTPQNNTEEYTAQNFIPPSENNADNWKVHREMESKQPESLLDDYPCDGVSHVKVGPKKYLFKCSCGYSGYTKRRRPPEALAFASSGCILLAGDLVFFPLIVFFWVPCVIPGCMDVTQVS